MDKEVREYWEDFCAEHGIEKDVPVEAWAFGIGGKQADYLAELVNRGKKTATTSAYEPYGLDGEEIPRPGEYNIILDGRGNPVCVTQTKVVEVIPFAQISAEHAWHEGEDDRSYESWRKVHVEFLSEQLKQYRLELTDDTPCVCEVFAKIG